MATPWSTTTNPWYHNPSFMVAKWTPPIKCGLELWGGNQNPISPIYPNALAPHYVMIQRSSQGGWNPVVELFDMDAIVFATTFQCLLDGGISLPFGKAKPVNTVDYEAFAAMVDFQEFESVANGLDFLEVKRLAARRAAVQFWLCSANAAMISKVVGNGPTGVALASLCSKTLSGGVLPWASSTGAGGTASTYSDAELHSLFGMPQSTDLMSSRTVPSPHLVTKSKGQWQGDFEGGYIDKHNQISAGVNAVVNPNLLKSPLSWYYYNDVWSDHIDGKVVEARFNLGWLWDSNPIHSLNGAFSVLETYVSPFSQATLSPSTFVAAIGLSATAALARDSFWREAAIYYSDSSDLDIASAGVGPRVRNAEPGFGEAAPQRFKVPSLAAMLEPVDREYSRHAIAQALQAVSRAMCIPSFTTASPSIYAFEGFVSDELVHHAVLAPNGGNVVSGGMCDSPTTQVLSWAVPINRVLLALPKTYNLLPEKRLKDGPQFDYLPLDLDGESILDQVLNTDPKLKGLYQKEPPKDPTTGEVLYTSALSLGAVIGFPLRPLICCPFAATAVVAPELFAGGRHGVRFQSLASADGGQTKGKHNSNIAYLVCDLTKHSMTIHAQNSIVVRYQRALTFAKVCAWIADKFGINYAYSNWFSTNPLSSAFGSGMTTNDKLGISYSIGWLAHLLSANLRSAANYMFTLPIIAGSVVYDPVQYKPSLLGSPYNDVQLNRFFLWRNWSAMHLGCVDRLGLALSTLPAPLPVPPLWLDLYPETRWYYKSVQTFFNLAPKIGSSLLTAEDLQPNPPEPVPWIQLAQKSLRYPYEQCATMLDVRSLYGSNPQKNQVGDITMTASSSQAGFFPTTLARANQLALTAIAYRVAMFFSAELTPVDGEFPGAVSQWKQMP